MRALRLVVMFLLGVGVAAVLGMVPQVIADSGRQVAFTNVPNTPTVLDLGAMGDSPTDLVVVSSAGFTDDTGRNGTVNGFEFYADLGDVAGDPFDDLLGIMVYDFGDGSTIVSMSKTFIPLEDNEIPIGQSVDRALVGGTGEFLGVMGVDAVTRNADDSYSHLLTLDR